MQPKTIKFSIGDKVRLFWHPHQPTGTVKHIVGRGSWTSEKSEYLVVYDGDLLPPEDWHKEDELELVSSGNGCFHEWIMYNGFRESYEYCTICDQRR